MYTMKTLAAVGVICCFAGFLVCLAIFNHICNGCLKSTFERERATEKMYTDALERLSQAMQSMDEMQKAQLCAFAEGLAMALEHSKRAS